MTQVLFSVVDTNGAIVREFSRKSDAARFANKNGFTVSTYDDSTALALVSDADASEAIDASDVDSLLASLDEAAPVETVGNDDTLTLRDQAMQFDVATVDSAVQALRASFDRRDAFEASNGLALASDSSYVRERNRMLKNEIAVSRFFLALGISASDVIERKVSSSSMFNAKALKKVTELAQYVVSYGVTMEKVTRAFIACGLIASDRGHTDITNDINRKFLNGSDFSAYISDQDLIDYLRDQRHVAMTSGAETQSSQARNVLDVLGLGVIKSVHKNRDAIALDTSHSFYAMFRKDFMK